MATRVLGPTGSRRRRRFLFVSLLLVACTALFLAGAAQAVHDEALQLDGDVSTHCYNAPTPTVTCASLLYDWGANATGNSSAQTDPNHAIFSVDPQHANTAAAPCVAPVSVETTCEQVTANPSLVPSVFPAASFQRDFLSGSACTLDSTSLTPCTGDSTTYATGSKDTLGIGIPAGGTQAGWQCNHDNNVNSKIDIANAYVAQYTGTTTDHVGDKIFYFGMEKNKTNGTNDVGIWFLHNNAGCSALTGHQNWSGSHHDGDTLVVSEFTQGGGVSTIKVFQWAANAQFPGDKGCIDSNDNPNPAVVVNGTKGCNGLSIGQGGDCKASGAGDNVCATTNANCTSNAKPCSKPWNQTVSTPWLSWDATGGVGNNKIVSPDFIEGGIDITKIFTQAGIPAPSCFNTIVPDTRSSAAITATLFDYVVNKIGGCGGGLSTSANASPNSREIAANGTISSDTDNATLQITGTPTWGGTLTWYLCGPDVSACDNQGYVVTSQTVASTDAACNGNPNGQCTYTSGSTTLTSAGTVNGEYCWHAHFEPNPDTAAAGVDPQDDTGSNECFFVTPKTPLLSTSASCSADPCIVGSTLNDYATLSGTARNPDPLNPGSNTTYPTINGGTKAADNSISWTLYPPATGGAASCSTTPVTTTPSSIQVSGDSTGLGYGPVSYVSDKVGSYDFAASYPGDGPNTLAAADVACDTSGTNGEQVTTTGTSSSSSAQRWLPNDRVVLSSTAGTTLHGTLTVKLYKGTFTIDTNGVCSADSGDTLEKTFGGVANNVSSATNSFVFNTNNSDFFVGTNADGTAGGADGEYFWLIQYTDNSLTSPADRCERTTLTINNSPSSGP